MLDGQRELVREPNQAGEEELEELWNKRMNDKPYNVFFSTCDEDFS